MRFFVFIRFAAVCFFGSKERIGETMPFFRFGSRKIKPKAEKNERKQKKKYTNFLEPKR